MAALLADIQLGFVRKHLRWVVAGLVAVLLSMTCYVLLVWAGWQTESVLWRCWWIPFIASITVTHVLLLRRAEAGHGDLAQRATPVCVVLTGFLVGGLALRRDLLGGPTPFYLGLIALPGAGSVIGSFIGWARWWRLRPKSAPVSPRTKLTLLITSYVGVLVVGLYRRIGALQPRSFEGFPSALGGLTSEQLDTRIQVDLERLKTVAAGIDRLEQELDLRHRLAVSLVYDLPFGPRQRWLGGANGFFPGLVRNWQVSSILTARSGQPFTPRLTIDNSNTGNVGGFFAHDRPNRVSDARLANPTPEQFFNVDAFEIPAPFSFGNSGRNILGGATLRTLDLALVRNIRIREETKLQFRMEFFNLLNRTNFDLPEGFVDRPTFGKIISAGPARQIQFALKLLF